MLHVFLLVGRGGSREQKKHKNQTDAKADPAPRRGDNHTHADMHIYFIQLYASVNLRRHSEWYEGSKLNWHLRLNISNLKKILSD